MKKLCCFLLALALAVMGVTLSALGAEPLDLVMSDGAAMPGGTVTVTLSAKNNPGMKGIGAVVDYDHDVLRLVSGQGNIADGTWMIDTIAQDDIVMWYSTTAFADDGDIVTLTFQVLDTAQKGTTTVGLAFGDWDSVSDASGKDITDFTVQTGTVTIQEPQTIQPGDTSGDGTIDLKDVTLLFQYVNGQIDALDNESAADVTGDDVIDLKDVTMLFQFVNGQIYAQ
jgi:hypothetical protein